MKRLNNKVQILISFLSLSLALTAAVTSIYAWFTSFREVSDNGLDMQIDGESINAMSVTTYWKYLEDETMIYVKSTKGTITLPTYDSVFEELNDNCEVFISIPVFGKTVNDGDDFTVTLSLKDMDKDKGYSGSAENMNHYEYDEEKKEYSHIVSLYLSNVVSITAGLIPELNDVSDNTDAGLKKIVDTSKSYFNEHGETHVFLNNESKAKTGEAVFSFTDYSDGRILVSDQEDPEEVYVVFVYLRITYDPDLINNMMEHRELSLGDQTFDITSDFERIVLSVEEE